jgi:hypothetical protein
MNQLTAYPILDVLKSGPHTKSQAMWSDNCGQAIQNRVAERLYLQKNSGGSGFGRERSGQTGSEHEGQRARLASARREQEISKRMNQ